MKESGKHVVAAAVDPPTIPPLCSTIEDTLPPPDSSFDPGTEDVIAAASVPMTPADFPEFGISPDTKEVVIICHVAAEELNCHSIAKLQTCRDLGMYSHRMHLLDFVL